MYSRYQSGNPLLGFISIIIFFANSILFGIFLASHTNLRFREKTKNEFIDILENGCLLLKIWSKSQTSRYGCVGSKGSHDTLINLIKEMKKNNLECEKLEEIFGREKYDKKDGSQSLINKAKTDKLIDQHKKIDYFLLCHNAHKIIAILFFWKYKNCLNCSLEQIDLPLIKYGETRDQVFEKFEYLYNFYHDLRRYNYFTDAMVDYDFEFLERNKQWEFKNMY